MDFLERVERKWDGLFREVGREKGYGLSTESTQRKGVGVVRESWTFQREKRMEGDVAGRPSASPQPPCTFLPYLSNPEGARSKLCTPQNILFRSPFLHSLVHVQEMGAFISKIENSNAVGTAGHLAELGMLFEAICRLAPGLLPLRNPHSVSLNPVYSNSPSTLALVLRYMRYKVYAPLFYLALVKYCVDDGDDRKTMAVVAQQLADGSPFGNMSTAELLDDIHKEKELLMDELTGRKNELEEELTSIEKWRKLWSKVDMVLSILLAVINSGALVAAKVMPASVTAVLLASLAAGNLLITIAMKVVDWWLGVTDDELKSQLESQKDGIKVMRRELLLLDLKPIRPLLENLKIKHIALRAVEIESNSTAPTEEAGQTQAADHLELEVKVKEMKKTVKKGMKDVRKMVERVEREVKKAAADFAHIITK